MAKTLEQLSKEATIIANETRAGANTALRVGGLFYDIIDSLDELDYSKKTDIESLRNDILTTEDGETIIKKNLVSLKGGDGVIVKDYNTISLLVDTDTFGFGENNELELIKVDGGLY